MKKKPALNNEVGHLGGFKVGTEWVIGIDQSYSILLETRAPTPLILERYFPLLLTKTSNDGKD